MCILYIINILHNHHSKLKVLNIYIGVRISNMSNSSDTESEIGHFTGNPDGIGRLEF